MHLTFWPLGRAPTWSLSVQFSQVLKFSSSYLEEKRRLLCHFQEKLEPVMGGAGGEQSRLLQRPQKPESWQLGETNREYHGVNSASNALKVKYLWVCVFACRNRGTAVRRAAWIWEELSFSGPASCPAEKTSSRWSDFNEKLDFRLKENVSSSAQNGKTLKCAIKYQQLCILFPERSICDKVNETSVCFCLDC